MAVMVAAGCGAACAQQAGGANGTIGTVGLAGATVGGALVVSNGRAVLAGNTTVTAGEHASEIALSRGGKVVVCATSGLHLTAGHGENAPLMLALDRGALEIEMTATKQDVVMTPDLRFTAAAEGPLNLRLRVTRNGDTCVESRGASAPTLHIADQFGGASYDLHAGQHVLFEHGDLREVVDTERSDCGCPPEPAAPTMTVADALIRPGAGGTDAATAGAAKTDADKAAEANPFPAAVSAGLAPTASTPPQAPEGALHTQVAATLSSDGGPDSTTVPPAPAATASVQGNGVQTAGTPTSVVAAPMSAGAGADVENGAKKTDQPGESKGFFHSVGHFFRRLFGGS